MTSSRTAAAVLIASIGAALIVAGCGPQAGWGSTSGASPSPIATASPIASPSPTSPSTGASPSPIASPSPGASPSPIAAAPDGTTTYTMSHDGVTRTYVLHVPARLDRTRPAPLLIELHGGGGDGAEIDRLTGFYAIADRERFVVAAPSGVNKNWNDGRPEIDTATGGADDVGFLSAMMDRIAGQVPVDRSRIYVTGMSNGAIMSGRLACELSDRIAAFGQVSGTASTEIAGSCHPGRSVPVLEIHGTADLVVPYAGGTVAPQLDGRGQVVGVDAWAAFWVADDADSSAPEITHIGSDTTVRTWHGASPQSDVVFYRVEGAGHTWPGGPDFPGRAVGSTTHSFSASAVIWEFLASHRLAS